MGADSTRAVTRSVSFVLYLTDDDFDATHDGGQLRIFELSDDGTASCDEGASGVAMEVPPKPGTLVLLSGDARWKWVHRAMPHPNAAGKARISLVLGCAASAF